MNARDILNDNTKIYPDVEDRGYFYVELPDGYRLKFYMHNGEYIGRYNPNLNEVI